MKRRPTQDLSAYNVLQALEDGPFASPAHAVLHEVRNATGYSGVTRSADALVVSVWPSRGIWFGGVEVKVSRSDFLAELRNPRKSEAIQQYCDYWWLAAPSGVIQPGEVPETWGHYEIVGKKARLVKEAPRLEAAALDRLFVASVLRNSVDRAKKAESAAVQLALNAWEEKNGQSALEEALNKANADIRELTLARDLLKNDHARLLSYIKSFEEASGVKLETWRPLESRYLGARVKLAERLGQGVDCRRIADALEEYARVVRGVDAELCSHYDAVKSHDAT